VHRYFVTGTDTGVGKTRVTAALALALRTHGHPATIVKLVQTGVRTHEPGDAQTAAELAEVPYLELARFFKAADPWAAALADGLPPVHAEDLARVLAGVEGAVVAEGAGGVAVPLNRKQSFADVAQLAALQAIVVVGLRLGCINHALLTAALLEQRGVPIAGAVFCEPWEPTPEDYREDVRRALQGKLNVLGIIPFDLDARRSIQAGARIFDQLVG
jgi:dethiobiotin synthetase